MIKVILKSVFLMIAIYMPIEALADGKVMPNGQKCADGWVCIPPGTGKKHVKHKPKPKPVQSEVACKTLDQQPIQRTVVVTREVQVYPKNHLRLLGGIGPTGLGIGLQPYQATLNQNYMAVFGVGYGRNVTERWSLELEGMTNGTGLVGIGFNW